MRDTERTHAAGDHSVARRAPRRRRGRHRVAPTRVLGMVIIGLFLTAAAVTGASGHRGSLGARGKSAETTVSLPSGSSLVATSTSSGVLTVRRWTASKVAAGAAGTPARSTVGSVHLTDVPAGWTASDHDLVSGGLHRSYLMVRPPAAKRHSLPVVMILHGRNLTPDIMERISGLLPDLGRAIAVYPAGWDRSWNAGGCCGVAHHDDVDDVAFLNAVVHQVLATSPDASPHRVYLVGFSNGGRMAMDLACQDGGRFAGLAAVEAVPVSPCDRPTPLPVMLIAQTGDPLLTIPTDGPRKRMQGYVEPTVGQTVDVWRHLDGCGSAATSATAGAVRSTVWRSCRGRGQVAYELYQGGAHAWPDGGGATPSGQHLIASFLLGYRPIATT